MMTNNIDNSAESLARKAAQLMGEANEQTADRLCNAARALYALAAAAPGDHRLPPASLANYTRVAYGPAAARTTGPSAISLHRLAERLFRLRPAVADALFSESRTPEQNIVLMEAGAELAHGTDAAELSLGYTLLAIAEPPFLKGYYRDRVATTPEFVARDRVYDETLVNHYPAIFAHALLINDRVAARPIQ
ncbi:MAG TPA: hypothetical protein VJZ91_18050 [Blastocatellia bacterium]|nr:hypothetical protein [Blastocatellia bacterium]